MSYELREEETIGAGLRRIACEQIERAISASNARRNGQGSPVHATRKHLKKARAVLRLVRGEVSPHLLHREERRLRNVGRLVSDIRDAEVRLETVKQLREQARSDDQRNFAETEGLLAFELDSFLAAFAGWQAEATSKLGRTREGIAQWSLADLTHHHVCRNVRTAYRRGRSALRKAAASNSADRFHELRKRAKELSYHLRILRPLHPAVFREMASELKTLTEHLGHAHDMAFVAARLNTLAGTTGRKRGQRALEALIDSREKDLQRVAITLAERFYAQKPKHFSARLGDFFEEWERARLHQSARFLEADVN